MDVLGDVLRTIRLRGSIYFNECFCSPWGMSIDSSTKTSFHIIVKGAAWLKLDDKKTPIKLEVGDIVIFPQGAAHRILDSPNSKCLKGSDVVEAYQKGINVFDGELDSFNIICGYVEFERTLSHPFINSLPELIHVNNAMRRQFHWLDNVIEQIVYESKEKSPGSNVLIDKFTEVLFIQVIRAYASQGNMNTSYLSALLDKQLSKALALMHTNPSQEWTVEQLASDVGMSRSSFYSRFNEYIGVPPSKYLYQWRMMQAKEKLEQTTKSVEVIAEEVGYQSDSAFQKAFKRFFKLTPASLRKKP